MNRYKVYWRNSEAFTVFDSNPLPEVIAGCIYFWDGTTPIAWVPLSSIQYMKRFG